MWQSKLVDIRLPENIELTVTYTESGDVAGMKKGTTLKKEAELSTGATVSVPLFVATGDVIVVNVQDRAYLRRADKYSKLATEVDKAKSQLPKPP
jgi:elongation factor P